MLARLACKRGVISRSLAGLVKWLVGLGLTFVLRATTPPDLLRDLDTPFTLLLLVCAWMACRHGVDFIHARFFLGRGASQAGGHVLKDLVKFLILVVLAGAGLKDILDIQLGSLLTSSAILTAVIGLSMPPTRRTALETTFRRQNGAIFPVELTLVSQETEGQAFVIAVARDVSSYRREEEQARAAQAFLASIINTIPDPIFVKDRTGRFLLVNDALAALLGSVPRNILGKRDVDFFPPGQATTFTAGDALVMGLTPKRCEMLRECAPLHDIGKIGIPDAVLLKPGALNPDEREIMILHFLVQNL